jgi:polyisoprenoid-binding protein YceI
MTSTAVEIPGWVAGTWAIDPFHSSVSFTARYMMVSKVRGRFTAFSGEIVTAADPLESTVTATIDLASVDTHQEQRDNHLRSADFFEVETHPTMTYRSTGIRPDGGDFVLDGDLTLKGVTRSVPLRLSVNGIAPFVDGGTVAGFSASGRINRRDFGVNFHAVVDGGGVVVSDDVTIELEIQALLKND